MVINKTKVILVAGARPNFMKIAPLMREFKSHQRFDTFLVHTGQHYDEKMSDLFFTQLGIPEPDINLEVGSASHAVQTADIMKAFEPVLQDYKPDAVLVVGDVNSTIACGLVATKLNVTVIHVEAGLRSFDRSMPEEINRTLTDSISDLLFCTEQSGVDNLLHEGVPQEHIHLVGNVMIDTLLRHLEVARESNILDILRRKGALNGDVFAVLTLHRPGNVDDPVVFSKILEALEIVAKDLPIIFPIHPRTRKSIIALGLQDKVNHLRNLHLLDPIGYLDFLKLQSMAKVVLTDSGGIQEEATVLKVPCLTLRENTERPITVQIGSNQIVGTDPEKIVTAYWKVINGNWREPQIPRLWDGRAAERIVDIISEKFLSRSYNDSLLVSAGSTYR